MAGKDPSAQAGAVLPTDLLDQHNALLGEARTSRAGVEAARLALDGAFSDAAAATVAVRGMGAKIREDPRTAALPAYQQAILAEGLSSRFPIFSYGTEYEPGAFDWIKKEPALVELMKPDDQTVTEYFETRERELRPIAEALTDKMEDIGEGVMAMVFDRKPNTDTFNIPTMHGLREITADSRPLTGLVHCAFTTASFGVDHHTGDKKVYGRSLDVPVDYYPNGPFAENDQIAKRTYILKADDLSPKVIDRLITGEGSDTSQAESIVLLGKDVVSAFIRELGNMPVNTPGSDLLKKIMEAERDPHSNDFLYAYNKDLYYMTPDTIDTHQAAWEIKAHIQMLTNYGVVADRVWEQLLTQTKPEPEDSRILVECSWYCVEKSKEGSPEQAVEAIAEQFGKKLEQEGVDAKTIATRQQHITDLLSRRNQATADKLVVSRADSLND